MAFTLHRCEKSRILPAVERCHYLHRWPDPRSLPFGYILERDGYQIAGLPYLEPWER